MKKIFTLISVALVAMSTSAQEVWKAADFDLSSAVETELTEGIYGAGTADAPDTSVPGSLTSSTITVTVDGLTMTGVSTPNSLSHKDVDEGKTQVYWELKGTVDGNDALITEDCNPQFAQYLMPKGNPEFTHWEFYETNSDGDEVFRAYGTYWEPGASAMPAKGAYYKFDATKAGTLKIGIYGNKNTNPTYIVDTETLQPIAPASVTVGIFYQNTGFNYEGSVDDGTAKYFNEGQMAEDYVLQHTNGVTQNRPVLGYITFDVAAGKTYYVFNPKSQIGIYGFQFTANETDGITNLTVAEQANAPLFNLAGQQVTKAYKGVVIQNGKKFIQK
ncbi:MAG: hypothetical protein IJV27_01925 [Prevotella sp.]|nr:hypothetical protein [Prevotella sp.]